MVEVTKTPQTENFPVALFFLDQDKRQRILNFYHFARKADEIADSERLSPPDKTAKLNELDQICPDVYARDLLVAFHTDVKKNRYATWQELLGYCEFSANPVGRFLLSLHHIHNPEALSASDKLCTVLQILNHTQDAVKDFKTLNRIYLPAEFFSTTLENVLTKTEITPEDRKGFNKLLAQTQLLLDQARPLLSTPLPFSFKIQVRMTFNCAAKLLDKLYKHDFIANRVELTKTDMIICLLTGIFKR